MHDIAKVINQVDSYIASLQENAPCVYRFSRIGEPGLISSCLAVMIRDLTGSIDTLSEQERASWIEYIQSFQDQETGLFKEPSDLGSNPYLRWSNCDYSICALQILGGRPKFPLTFLHELSDRAKLDTYLAEIDWSSAGLESNFIMFLLDILEFDKSQFSSYQETVDAVFEYMDAKQDPETGLWGMKEGSYYCSGLAGAYHLVFFYNYYNRPLNHVDNMIDSILLCRYRDRYVYPEIWGHPCGDFDTVDLIVRLASMSNYRQDELRDWMKDLYNGTLKHHCQDGGFNWMNFRFLSPLDIVPIISLGLKQNSLKNKIKLPLRTIKDQLKFLIDKPAVYESIKDRGGTTFMHQESNIFATFMRLNSCLFLHKALYPESQLRFKRTLGLGWYGLS
ncbi:hypothetical protein [Aliiglaciecola litoralis]|uniref:Uncharacterized protein n=1 Tax=Aliiglaciecola litoralis TaxID=582857 RepID=A0ABN1LJ97_9ALTE